MPLHPCYGSDTLLDELGTAEVLLAVTFRLFALPFVEPNRNHPDWREGLRAGDLPSWTPLAFEALLNVVVAATRRPLDVGCLLCPTLSHDEGRLIQIVSRFQHRHYEEAASALESWLPSAACRLAVSPACGLAKGLQKTGLIIPLRWDASAPAPTHQLSAHPGLALLH